MEQTILFSIQSYAERTLPSCSPFSARTCKKFCTRKVSAALGFRAFDSWAYRCFVTENKPHLEDILQSIPHYIANDSLAPDQRFGFILLNKLLAIWVDPFRAPTAPPLAIPLPLSPVPGFEQFLYSNVVKLCFEVPLKADFDYGDAQSFQVCLWYTSCDWIWYSLLLLFP